MTTLAVYNSGTSRFEPVEDEDFPTNTRFELYVDTSTGSNNDNGRSWANAFATITAALSAASSGDVIYVAPGEYDEAVTVARAKSNIQIIGVGGRGAAFIAPSTTNATALTVLADDVTIKNLGCDGDGTGSGCINYGRRFRAVGCKFEGGDGANGTGLTLTLGTDAQITALTHGKGDDSRIEDCEFAYNTHGLRLVCTDYGAVTQARIYDCYFHDNTNGIEEANGSGGSASVRYRDLEILRCRFLRNEDGTEPTMYVALNDDNGNKGVMANCVIPSAINGGKVLVSTGLIYVGNYHTGGLSTAQPS